MPKPNSKSVKNQTHEILKEYYTQINKLEHKDTFVDLLLQSSVLFEQKPVIFFKNNLE
ncbi:hypothetical protein BB560_001319 [Smittium megazygosporum]|uniref:Uncharacterized protein n=1 Tax=Smittium megazygosporum TaxID=133381 RepID=A0A2T9ZHT9_9FUNG|nr:hypothetical protein BB560_001319 [Smittium megazygosporum]